MLIVLLAFLGVSLAVVVAFLIAVLGRRRWIQRQPGAFAGLARVVDGEVQGFGSKSHRGYGRWTRDTLVWSHAPVFVRSTHVPIDSKVGSQRATEEFRRLGDAPIVVTLVSGTSRIQLIVKSGDELLASPPAGSSTG